MKIQYIKCIYKADHSKIFIFFSFFDSLQDILSGAITIVVLKLQSFIWSYSQKTFRDRPVNIYTHFFRIDIFNLPETMGGKITPIKFQLLNIKLVLLPQSDLFTL